MRLRRPSMSSLRLPSAEPRVRWRGSSRSSSGPPVTALLDDDEVLAPIGIHAPELDPLACRLAAARKFERGGWGADRIALLSLEPGLYAEWRGHQSLSGEEQLDWVGEKNHRHYADGHEGSIERTNGRRLDVEVTLFYG